MADLFNFDEKEKKLIDSLRALKETEGNFDFLNNLKGLLLSEVASADFEISRPFMPRLLRFSLSFSGALVLILGLAGGAAWASQKSLPNDLLYPVKLAAEKTRLALAANEIARANLRVQFAERRLQEVTEIGKRDIPDNKTTAKTLALFEREVRELHQEIDKAEGKSQDGELIQSLLGIERKLSGELEALESFKAKVAGGGAKDQSVATAFDQAEEIAKLGLERTEDRIFSLQIKTGIRGTADTLADKRLARAFQKIESRISSLERLVAERESAELQILSEEKPTLAAEPTPPAGEGIASRLEKVRQELTALKEEAGAQEKYLETVKKLQTLQDELAEIESELGN